MFPPHKASTINCKLVYPPDHTLHFESRFESGNLEKAYKLSEDEYNLYLEFDISTKKHTQWFYFSVKNYKSNHQVKFNIVNLMKYDSLYNNGLKPAVYSEKDFNESGLRWHRAGEEISYFKNSSESESKKGYFTLTFKYTFKHPNDKVYFAHCYPYTYTDLNNFLKTLEEYPSIARVDSLCSTLAGNSCPVVTITSKIQTYTEPSCENLKVNRTAAGRAVVRLREAKKSKSGASMPETEHKTKKGVMITARVHPGETNSSHLVEGLIKFLLGNSKSARALRKNFVFRIIPMLNPDGVVYGNYRCSLLGVDLNRRWLKPNKCLHPTIFYAKRFIQMFSEEHELAMFCDIHGHSMKKNVFMYSCCVLGNRFEDKRKNILIKLIPILMSEKNKVFSFPDTRFQLEKKKESTARIVVFKEMNVLNSYTFEISFFGPEHSATLENRDPLVNEPSQDAHLLVSHLETLGADLAEVCLAFSNKNLFRSKLEEIRTKFSSQPSEKSFAKRRSVKRQVNQTTLDVPSEDLTMTSALRAIECTENIMEIENLWNINEEYDNKESVSGSSEFEPKFSHEFKKKLNVKRSRSVIKQNHSPEITKNRHTPSSRRNQSYLPENTEKSPMLQDHLKRLQSLSNF